MSVPPPSQQDATLLAVSISPGGIPKCNVTAGMVDRAGIVGDGRNHAKHIRPDRAVSLLDHEIMQQLVDEGFPLVPGATGENLTVARLDVQHLAPGTLLKIGEAVLRLEQPRKPCYVLDAIDPRLKDAIVGRCGYLASVVREGRIQPGMRVVVMSEEPSGNPGGGACAGVSVPPASFEQPASGWPGAGEMQSGYSAG